MPLEGCVLLITMKIASRVDRIIFKKTLNGLRINEGGDGVLYRSFGKSDILGDYYRFRKNLLQVWIFGW